MSRVAWTLLAVSVVFIFERSAAAQGLLWSIPQEEGKWVRYEGTYGQVMKRPDDPQGDLKLNWSRHMTIKALNNEEGEIDGQTIPCRWIEIKMITGPVKEGIIDAGPGGTRLYKVLVPVESISKVTINANQEVINAERVLATFVRIAKGYRKIGNESPAPIETGVFQVYPALTVVQHYRELKDLGMEDVALRNASVPTTHLQGEMVTEDLFTRSTNKADIWKSESPEVPFGVAKWQVTVLVERKDSTDGRGNFAPISEITEEMATAEIGDAAESELVLD